MPPLPGPALGTAQELVDVEFGTFNLSLSFRTYQSEFSDHLPKNTCHPRRTKWDSWVQVDLLSHNVHECRPGIYKVSSP